MSAFRVAVREEGGSNAHLSLFWIMGIVALRVGRMRYFSKSPDFAQDPNIGMSRVLPYSKAVLGDCVLVFLSPVLHSPSALGAVVWATAAVTRGRDTLEGISVVRSF